ncbi:hypothetical protein DSM104299_00961 [Baekduia alba]|uniref:alpha/beta fold hydrolase n=1 Tax=Baekduia alba TaxID=2997333 RepID=UPI002342426C|nr:alpha/beta hydrolase [Baekduia alba]WCB92271.1 hypothetical protein DSM104299_00961 [Baekduia alba]
MTPRVEHLGRSGERVVLVHGSLIAGMAAWQEQRDLARQRRLVIVERHGYGEHASTGRVDLERDERDLIEVLEDGAHLVGTSMGGVVALRVAGRRPELIRSLTVIEPPLLADHGGDAIVDRAIEQVREAYRRGRDEPDSAFLRRFLAAIEFDMPLPDPLPAPLVQATTLLRSEQPWAVRAPLLEVASASYAKLVISGGSSPVFERVCDALARDVGAERMLFSGSPHAVQRIGGPFNDYLEGFLSRVEAQTAEKMSSDAKA